MHQNHFLWHLGKRPEGCHHYRPRQCLLKGCERLFWPRQPQTRYCSEACRQSARRWRRRKASQKYRVTAKGRQRRQEQARRYRQQQGEHVATASADEAAPCEATLRAKEEAVLIATASADEAAPCEGQRPAPVAENSATRRCARPGCYEFFAIPHEQSCKRFCSIACRLALRRVLDREARYQARRRRMRCERVTKRARPPDTS